ncbi:MAG: SMI1/KNR4 family protein [Bacillota bacterium]
MNEINCKSEFITRVEQMLEHYQSLYDGNGPYVLNDQLTEDQIEEFEAAAKVVLPQDYKDFLLHIGNGGKQGHHGRPFPLSLSHAKDCIESNLNTTIGLEYMSLPFSLESCNRYFGDGFENIDEDLADEEYDRMVMEALHGTITLHNDGCGYYIVMIVSGEHAGKLYYIDTCHGQGTYLVSNSFSDYYIKWLDRKITERLAHLEHNDKFSCVITKVKLGGSVRDLHVRKDQYHYSFQFEYFCPGDFVREGGYSEHTRVGDRLVVSLYMEHKSWMPLELEKIEEQDERGALQPLTVIGERSEHIVIGRVNRLFMHDPGEKCFPLYVEGLEQEVLVKGLKELVVSVGDVYKVKGQLNGNVYRIMR